MTMMMMMWRGQAIPNEVRDEEAGKEVKQKMRKIQMQKRTKLKTNKRTREKRSGQRTQTTTTKRMKQKLKKMKLKETKKERKKVWMKHPNQQKQTQQTEGKQKAILCWLPLSLSTEFSLRVALWAQRWHDIRRPRHSRHPPPRLLDPDLHSRHIPPLLSPLQHLHSLLLLHHFLLPCRGQLLLFQPFVGLRGFLLRSSHLHFAQLLVHRVLLFFVFLSLLLPMCFPPLRSEPKESWYQVCVVVVRAVVVAAAADAGSALHIHLFLHHDLVVSSLRHFCRSVVPIVSLFLFFLMLFLLLPLRTFFLFKLLRRQ